MAASEMAWVIAAQALRQKREVRLIQLKNSIHFGQAQNDATWHGQTAAAEARPRTASHYWGFLIISQPEHFGHLFWVCCKNQAFRHLPQPGRAVER